MFSDSGIVVVPVRVWRLCVTLTSQGKAVVVVIVIVSTVTTELDKRIISIILNNLF